jgi:hypothetical protein
MSQVEAELGGLPERESEILMMRFGISRQPRPLDEVASQRGAVKLGGGVVSFAGLPLLPRRGPPKVEDHPKGRVPGPPCMLFISNVHREEVSEEKLRELLEHAAGGPGMLQRLKMHKPGMRNSNWVSDRFFHTGKGIAIFADEAAADRVRWMLDDSELCGRPIYACHIADLPTTMNILGFSNEDQACPAFTPVQLRDRGDRGDRGEQNGEQTGERSGKQTRRAWEPRGAWQARARGLHLDLARLSFWLDRSALDLAALAANCASVRTSCG